MTRARDLADLASSGVIEGTEVADDAITLAKMASGTDGNIISYDASGNPVAIATGSDGQVLTSAGAGQPPAFEAIGATVGGSSGVDFNDSVKARFGTGNDLEIYHDASDSIIADVGTGNLQIRADDFYLMKQDGSETMIRADTDGAVKLYYDNAVKLETISGGVGFPDSSRVSLGAGQDFELYHDGSTSYVRNSTGDLVISDNDGDIKIQGKHGEDSIVANNDGAVELYHDNAKKLETTSGGADVTGGLGVGTAKDLGVGIHIKTADSGVSSVDGSADELIIEGSGNSGLSILSGTSGVGGVLFGDSGSSGIGQLDYYHSDNSMRFITSGTAQWKIDTSGDLVPMVANNGIVLGTTSNVAAQRLDEYKQEQSFTPTWTVAGGGSVTSVSNGVAQWWKIGNIIYVSIYAAPVNTSGTVTEYSVTLPYASNGHCSFGIREFAQTNQTYSGRLSDSSSTLTIKKYDGLSPAANAYLQIGIPYATFT